MMLGLLWTPDFAAAQTTVVLPPVFSVPRGFYNSSFNLTLTSPSGGSIRYTLNGNAPTPTSGTVYSGAISLSTTTVVRAIAYTSPTAKSAVATNTYIFLAAVRNQPDTAPAGWPAQYFAAADDVGVYPSDYGMDPEILNHPNYSGAGKFESVMKSLPSLSVVTDLPNLWDPSYGIYYNSNAKEGHEDYPNGDPYNNPVSPGKWERPVSLELINPDGSTGFQIDGGIRMHGQASRRPKRTPKHSFRVYFKKGYGVGNLDFQLFSDATAVGKFDRLTLRNGGNRSWPYFDRDQRRETDYVNDEWARQTWDDMGHLAPHGMYVHLYLNGLYWGLYNVAERIDEKYLSAYLNTLETDVDLIESEEEQDDNAVASAGTMDAYNELLGLISPGSSTPITNAQYNIIKTKVDVVDMADYFIHVHFIGKTDWPDHNFNLYRARVGPDTRFKFIAWDNDSGLNKVLQDTTLMTETMTHPYIMGPDGYMVPDTSQPLMYDAPIQIFNRLTTNAEFRQVVTDRFYKNVVDPKGMLAPAHCAQVYTELTAQVDQAVIGESARWGDYSRDKYPPTNIIDLLDKPFPAYLYSRDLPNAYTDPTNAVADDVQKTWLQVRNEKLNVYCPNRSNVVLSQYQANGWYQAPLQVPGISQRGGTVAVANPTVTLNNTLNNGSGDIYYTTNGVDPRQEFGTLSPNAVRGDGAEADQATITISRATTLKARVRNGSNWSPLLEYVFAPTQALSNLVINEVHYIPTVQPVTLDAKQYEFIELYNKGTTPLQLDRVKFARGITYEFPANSEILPGQYLVLASNAGLFQGRYGFPAWAVYAGSLANEGEAIELVDAIGTSFTRVDYKSVAPWPSLLAPDAGKSLSLFSPTLDTTLPANWRASTQVNGTPGAPNFSQQGQQVPTILWTTPTDITYGDALSAMHLNATISGAPGAAGGIFSYDPPLGTVLNAGYGQQLRVTFTPNDTTNYATSTATTRINVERSPLTVVADNKFWRTGTPFPALTASYSGFVNGDDVTDIDTPVSLSTTATANSPLGVYPITAADGVDNNYAMTYVAGTLTVTDKAIPQLSWTPAALTYGLPLSVEQLNATATENGQAVAGTFSYTPELGTMLNAGNHTLSVSFTPANSVAYVSVSLTVPFSVAKAPLTITAANKAKQVGTANPTLTAIYSGFVNGDDASDLDTPALLSTTATSESPLGVYPITVTGASAKNYAITFVNGSLSVSAGPVAEEYRLFLPLTAK
jgi:hypothetical protein